MDPTVNSVYSYENEEFDFKGCLKGDMDLTNKVDLADYSPWLFQYRTEENNVPRRGDMDQNGKVDLADYSPWLFQYRLFS